MTVEERIRYLLHAAVRAEQEGAEKVARSLRRMAEEARPLILGETRTENAAASSWPE